MTDSTNEKRPVRKLTVKNFSVIKEAELEFGKITVLIGPQASGKSLLCKLAYFLGREVIKIAVDMAVHRLSLTEFTSAVEKEFTKWFPRGGWASDSWSISYSEHHYKVTIACATPSTELPPKAVFSPGRSFENAYNVQLAETDQAMREKGFLLAPAIQSRAATRFFRIAGRGVWDASTYIPTQRSYFVDTRKGYRSLAAEADRISSDFADVFANGLKPTSPASRVPGFLGGKIVNIQNEWMFAFDDGRYLPISELSSGSKETLPILTSLDYYEEQRRGSGSLTTEVLYGDRLYYHDDFVIEEPESSVFPQTQYELVREFAALTNETKFAPHFAITTHSPYILSGFADLVKAGKVGNESPEHRKAVANVIPEQYWIKPEDFAAYKIEGGYLKTIFDRDSGQIDGDYLDDVSGKISDELGQLLEIQYGK
jgi:predicted ATPase